MKTLKRILIGIGLFIAASSLVVFIISIFALIWSDHDTDVWLKLCFTTVITTTICAIIWNLIDDNI